VTRIALISDLHGNELALDAVLRDIGKGADRLICLGDTATLGPRPREVLARLRDLGCPCIVGNHDAFLLDEQLIRSYTEAPIIVDSVDWCRAQLNDDELGFVRSFVPTLELPLDGDATLFLYHGTPRSHMEDMLADTPADVVDRMLDGKRGTVMAGGHTHIPMLRQHRGILIVNPGSLGAPFREYPAGQTPKILSHAEYAVVESRAGRVSVELHRVDLDPKALREVNAASDNPLGPSLVRQYSS
jgi:predicted phosphodiesterase